jgi:prepilin-type N-terminal cleavage/methylation domain-containing protein
MKTRKDESTGVFFARAAGFSLVEMLIAMLILGVLTASLFPLLNDFQREAAYRSETQAVLDNIRVAVETLEKYIRQAGNDPHGAGFQGITIISDRAVAIQSDLKGSHGSDKGDPNGDIDGSDETVTLRFNPANQSVEIVAGGAAQIVCNHVSDLKFRYYDSDGNLTTDGSRVRRIAVTISGLADRPNPKTREVFGIELEREIRIFS